MPELKKTVHPDGTVEVEVVHTNADKEVSKKPKKKVSDED